VEHRSWSRKFIGPCSSRRKKGGGASIKVDLDGLTCGLDTNFVSWRDIGTKKLRSKERQGRGGGKVVGGRGEPAKKNYLKIIDAMEV